MTNFMMFPGRKGLGTYPDGLVNFPLFGFHTIADVVEEVDEQLALDAVVDDHGSVGKVEYNEANQGYDY